MILKEVGYLFHVHVDSSVCVEPKNRLLPLTEWPSRQNLAGNHILLSRRILPAASAKQQCHNPGVNYISWGWLLQVWLHFVNS